MAVEYEKLVMFGHDAMPFGCVDGQGVCMQGIHVC